MGLDNIPAVYPCQKTGTAVMEERNGDQMISCDATIAANGCPWKQEVDKQERGTAVYGMFGVPCWYRGKVGTWMLRTLDEAGYSPPDRGFYGDDDSEPNLSAEYCNELAGFMEEHAETYAKQVRIEVEKTLADEPLPEGRTIDDVVKDKIETYRYAAWWLRFVAKFADGANAWY